MEVAIKQRAYQNISLAMCAMSAHPEDSHSEAKAMEW